MVGLYQGVQEVIVTMVNELFFHLFTGRKQPTDIGVGVKRTFTKYQQDIPVVLVVKHRFFPSDELQCQVSIIFRINLQQDPLNRPLNLSI